MYCILKTMYFYLKINVNLKVRGHCALRKDVGYMLKALLSWGLSYDSSENPIDIVMSYSRSMKYKINFSVLN